MPTEPSVAPLKIGQTGEPSEEDWGNAGLVLAQPASLAQQGTILSLSFYVSTVTHAPTGNLRMAIYDSAGNNPGTKLAETDEFTPVAGWNTAPVTTHVLLQPGTYWLAYMPSSSDLHFRIDRSVGTSVWTNAAWGPMPAAFPGSNLERAPGQWSMYATFGLSGEATVPVTIDPGGYLGSVQVDGVEGWSGGAVKTLDLAPGIYTLRGYNSRNLSGTDSAFGRFQVADGVVTPLEGLADSWHMEGNLKLVATTVGVPINMTGFGGSVEWAGAVGVTALSDATRLIVKRKYALVMQQSWGLTTNGKNVSSMNEGFGVTVHTEDSVVPPPVELDDDTRVSFSVTGLHLTAKTAQVKVNFVGFPGTLDWYLVSPVTPESPTVSLIRGRRYALRHVGSHTMSAADPSFSPGGYAVSLHAEGASPQLSIEDDEMKKSFRVSDTDPLELVAKTVPVKVAFNNYPGTLAWYWLPTITPGSGPVSLIRNRRYALVDYGSWAKDVANNSFSPESYAILVNPETDPAPLTVLPPVDVSFKVGGPDGLELAAQVRPVKVRFPGSPFPWPLIWFWVGDILGPNNETPMIVGRRYALFQYGSWALNADEPSFTPGTLGFTLNPELPANVPAIELDSEAATHFTHEGTTLTAIEARLTLDPGGYTGQVCIDNTLCTQGGQLLKADVAVGRRYHVGGADWFKVLATGACDVDHVMMGSVRVNIECHLASAECIAAADGTRCAGGDECRQNICRNGTCVAAAPTPIDDQNPCTLDACDPLTGVSHVPDLGADGVAFDAAGCGARTCAAGVCAPDSNAAAECSVHPIGACALADGTGVFGFENTSPTNISLPPGPLNNFGSAGTDLGQPQWFAPGTHSFRVKAPATPLTWTLGMQSATLADLLSTCNVTSDGGGEESVWLASAAVPVRPDAKAALTGAIVATDSADGTTTAGAIPGSFAVSADGGATYQVPIWVPPGRNSMQPSLTLSYNSQNGSNHGPLGLGWSLAGLSEIRRCKRTLALDGEPGPITLDSDSALCLDGSRLVAIAESALAGC